MIQEGKEDEISLCAWAKEASRMGAAQWPDTAYLHPGQPGLQGKLPRLAPPCPAWPHLALPSPGLTGDSDLCNISVHWGRSSNPLKGTHGRAGGRGQAGSPGQALAWAARLRWRVAASRRRAANESTGNGRGGDRCGEAAPGMARHHPRQDQGKTWSGYAGHALCKLWSRHAVAGQQAGARQKVPRGPSSNDVGRQRVDTHLNDTGKAKTMGEGSPRRWVSWPAG